MPRLIFLESIIWLLDDDTKLVLEFSILEDERVSFHRRNQTNEMLVNAKQSVCIFFCSSEPNIGYDEIRKLGQEQVKDLNYLVINT